MNINNLLKPLVFITVLSINAFVQAATIVVGDPNGDIVDNDLCSISEAITNANEDTAITFDCPAGSGADTIVLSTDITLGAVALDNDLIYGATGTPVISSLIIIDGRGHTLKRSTACTADGVVDDGEYRLLRNRPGGNFTLKNITLENGCADGTGLFAHGGAVLNHSGASLAIINSVFKSNHANGSGGGISNIDVSHISEITSSQFINNMANDSGGAIENVYFSTINLIDNSEFSENQAISDGGAIINTDGDLNEAFIGTIQNSTFSKNSANNGGAIANYFSSIDFINNLTFVDNNALGSGGSIWNFNFNTILMLRNSLFKNNSQASGNECFGISSGSNNLSNLSTENCSGATANSLTGSTVAALAYNGGNTRTHGLLPGSEAINASGAGATTNGQRGLGIDVIRDIGAFEHFGCLASGLNVDGFSTQVDSVERFITSVICANSNGSMTDTIELSQDITLTQEYENDASFGRTGTPAITSPIIINGSGYALKRDASLSCNDDDINDPNEFRLLHVASNGDLKLQNIKLSNGCVDSNIPFYGSGGAIFNSGIVAINDSVLNDNVSIRVFGGALYNRQTITTINNNSFSGNRAFIGGALYNEENITKISNNTFSDNTSALVGGGIFTQGSVFSINNNTFSNNIANAGAGIYNTNGGNSITNLLNNTFSGNSSGNGAGVYNNNGSTILLMENNLFYQNTKFPNSNGSEIDCYNNSLITGNNNLSDQISNNCSSVIDMTNLDSNSVDVLADNGCTTPLADGNCVLTHALLIGSEAIDTGGANATNKDQRDFISNGFRDIGAFEYDGIVDVIFKNSF